MDNSTSKQNEQLVNLLAQRVENNRADLVDRYFSVLRESLFSNRAELRPNMLKKIAEDEADGLLHFLRQSGFSGAERGEQLHVAGFNAGAILRLSQVTRQFLLNHLEDHQIAPMLDTVHAYQEAVIQGFVKSLEKDFHTEVERTRRAVQRGGS
jgi:uncharacterized protein YihD (DUF1040 family)